MEKKEGRGLEKGEKDITSEVTPKAASMGLYTVRNKGERTSIH